VQYIKTQQRVGVHLVSAQQQKVNLAADQRNCGGQVGADGDGPECKLVPGQQVTRVAEQQRDQKEHYADHPVELARSSVRTAIEDFKHVREDQEDHQLRRPAVQIPEKESRRYDKLQVLHVGVGLRHRRVVVKHEQNAGDDKDQERPKGKRAKVPCSAEADHALANFGGKQVQEDILLDGECAVQRA
jgi:hypothetical protein